MMTSKNGKILTVFDLLMTSNDLYKWPKMTSKISYNFDFMHIKLKNPGNKVTATNPVFGLIMTYNDLNDLQK